MVVEVIQGQIHVNNLTLHDFGQVKVIEGDLRPKRAEVFMTGHGPLFANDEPVDEEIWTFVNLAAGEHTLRAEEGKPFTEIRIQGHWWIEANVARYTLMCVLLPYIDKWPDGQLLWSADD